MPITGITKYEIDPEIYCKYCLSDNEKGFLICSTCGQRYNPNYKSGIITFTKKSKDSTEKRT